MTDSREFKIIGDGFDDNKEEDIEDILSFKVTGFIDMDNYALSK